MTLFSPADRAFAEAVSQMAHSNPFLPERIELEHQALGQDYVKVDIVWNKRADLMGDHSNITRVRQRLESLVPPLRERLARGERAETPELILYEDMVNYLLYDRYRLKFGALIQKAGERKSAPSKIDFYREFLHDAEFLLGFPGYPRRPYFEFNHLFASGFQVCRAFHNIFDFIIGESMPMARLRAMVWESIFTHDRRRYWRSLFSRTADVTCLVTGPSGSGKELVARAIGLSGYIPFDPRAEAFIEDFSVAFHPLNISALTPTLVESELFGHRRGAFTGALADRIGWLESCSPLGTVFLDEIGELDEAIQVKLLRVLQARTFQRIGDTADRVFRGKIIAATNRDLAAEIARKSFREDFYYRLCSDIIVTPTLREQLVDCAAALPTLILHITRQMVGAAEAEPLAAEAQAWIEKKMDPAYAWPGNVRELEQCVRNILIHGRYHPLAVRPAGPGTLCEELAESLAAASLTAEEVLQRYCTIVYARTRNYKETARLLGLDHRTIKSKILPDLLERLGAGG